MSGQFFFRKTENFWWGVANKKLGCFHGHPNVYDAKLKFKRNESKKAQNAVFEKLKLGTTNILYTGLSQ